MRAVLFLVAIAQDCTLRQKTYFMSKNHILNSFFFFLQTYFLFPFQIGGRKISFNESRIFGQKKKNSIFGSVCTLHALD